LKTKKLYCLSGLGADHRLYANISYPKDYEVVPLPWIPHLPEENLEEYARRLIRHYGIEEGQVIAGVSLGGIVAGIIHDQIPQEKIIVISSITCSLQLPSLYRLSWLLPLAEMIAGSKGHGIRPAMRFFMHPENKEEAALMSDYAQKLSPDHLFWVCRNVLAWRKEHEAENVIRIHGTRDRVFPLRGKKCCFLIKGGGHLMVLNRSEEISRILERVLGPDSCC
jgi:pimeloyl-ACP methyl ester carboxylesterase